MKRILACLFFSGIALACWRCEGGGSSETEGLTLAGRVVDSAQHPWPRARVALFPAAPAGRADSLPAAMDSTRSDAAGRFAFRGVAPGSYSVTILSEDSSHAAMRAGIEVAGDDSLEALSLRPASSLTGQVPPGFPYSRAKQVGLLGTPFGSPVSADGSYRITGITEGTYPLGLILRTAETPSNPSVIGALDTVQALPGQAIVAPSLQVPALPGTGPFLVDDFADCDLRNSLRGLWWTGGDGADSRVPRFDAADPQDGSGGCAARFTFAFGHAAQYPFVGIGTYFWPYTDSLPRAVDFTGATGISFRMKGSGVAMEVLLQSSVSGIVSGQGFNIDSIPATWTTYSLDFGADMKDSYDSADIRSWRQRRKAITHIQFDAIPAAGIDTGTIWIDDLRILRP
ncbi:MAG: carboxypeptidase regulatory-like domain-containing protein [Fibrobacteres bacterium]|nr:carboxypeptidase regulatory-like domain-containing protein [Fibrobacterota bacterium]